MRSLPFLSLLFLLFSGCALPTGEVDTLSYSITNGSAEAIGVLALLNNPSTDLETLDFDARLNVRSARNLMFHRDGFDGVPGTYDDDLFNNLAEVDSVRWVGPSTLAQLVSYAASFGWIPQGQDILGTWDNVTFTVVEADDTLALVNDVDQSTLDIDLGLDRRAADSIVSAQPIATIEELAALYYVGRSTLTVLKAASGEPEPPAEEFSDQFNHDEELDIPDGDATGVDSEVRVPAVPDIDLQVTFLVDFQHESPEDLQVELTAPNGQSWDLTNGSSSVNVVLDYSADPEGYWVLNVADTVSVTEGTIYGWALEVVNAP